MSSVVVVFDLSLLKTMNAFGASPLISSFTPITAASATSGWLLRISSSSAGATWKPFT